MIELDAKREYQMVRDSHKMGPHDGRDSRDLELLDFYLAGVGRGIAHACDNFKHDVVRDTMPVAPPAGGL